MKKIITLLALFALYACSNPGQGSSSSAGLRDYAKAAGISIGSLYNYSYSESSYPDHGTYNKILSNEFDTISLEWEFAMDTLWIGPTEYDYTFLDKAFEFAQAHNVKIRGTHLVWYSTIPDWLENGSYTNGEIQSMLQEYITALGNHIQNKYPGVLSEVNVVNEVIRDDSDSDTTYGIYRNKFLPEKLGATFVKDLFNLADTAFPDTKLFLNDYGNEMSGDKTTRFLSLVDSLITDGAPIDGVGLQAHFTIHDIQEDLFDSASFAGVLTEYANRNLEIAITELDVRINDDQTGVTDAKLSEQADVYRDVFSTALSNSDVTSISLWGFQDDLSYLNGRAGWLVQDRDWGLIYDSAFARKPAYYTIVETLRK